MSVLSDKIGQFITIPNTVYKMIPELGTNAFILFTCLRFHSDEHDVSFPSYECIGSETSLHRHSIAKAIRTLEAAGLLERRRRFSNSTIYILKLPAISTNLVLMDSDPLVQNMHSISANFVPSLVQILHSNQIHLTRLNELDSIGKTNDDEDEFFRQVMIETGLMATANDLPAMTGWYQRGTTIADIKAAILWRVDNGKKSIKTISQLAGGVEVSRQRRIQGFTNKPTQTTVNGITVIQARD